MKIEDYNEYYIQGSDHYLIPNDEFKELFNEMVNWKEESQKQKEVINKAIEYLNNVPNITAVVKIPNKPNEELLVGQTLYQKDIIELVKILGRYKGDNK